MYATWLWSPVSNPPSVLWEKYSHSYFIEGLTLGRGATASHIWVTFEVIGRDETLLGGTGRASRMDHGAYQWWGEGEGVIREGEETQERPGSLRLVQGALGGVEGWAGPLLQVRKGGPGEMLVENSAWATAAAWPQAPQKLVLLCECQRWVFRSTGALIPVGFSSVVQTLVPQAPLFFLSALRLSCGAEGKSEDTWSQGCWPRARLPLREALPWAATWDPGAFMHHFV